MPLLYNRPDVPHLDRLAPRAAIPGGSFEVIGSHLMPITNDGPQLPNAFFGEIEATFDMVRPSRALVRVPEGAISSDLIVKHQGHASNPLHASIGVPMAEDLHLVSNPAIDAEGNVFAMVSGPRGERTAIAIYKIAPDLQIRPFARELMNISALAFDREGNLFASSRQEGTVYRLTPTGEISAWAEGMGVATGLAFDAKGSLYVGDRSGTIFKIDERPGATPDAPATREIFVFATLEPSVAAYHLAFRSDGKLFVSAPTTSSNQPIYQIDPDGSVSVFFRGLGRPQGIAFDEDDNLYVAASWRGQRGIIRITPYGDAELTVSGNDLVGLCFLDDGCAALATNNTLFHADLGITGRSLI
ncbi:Sugar lactone lactonase YvrE [Bryocella elongata]|uniref:Sugar lactone lactonase YvrE n=1 Tax=Bryocella elongata TaxID=863522 RepID=A0A1H5X2S1_9BACT|nr:gluconolaconase [Bryocella elongata]SEG06134.1 Sugar lactone lactonase YvrE [Bryocella elongata]